MDELTRELLFKDYCPFAAAGKEYRVYPMSAGQVANEEFKSALVRPNFNDENPGYGVLLIMLDSELQADADRWLREHCTHEDIPMSLEIVLDHGWELPDFGRFLNLVGRLSGLSLCKDAGGEETADMADGFMSMMTFLQKYAGMGREEILASPLLRLHAQHTATLKHVEVDLQASAMGGLGAVLGGGRSDGPSQDVTREISQEEYDAML